MPKGIASLGLGSNGYRRAVAANSFDAAGPSALRFSSCFHNDGPWTNPEDYRKLNGVLRFSQGTNADGYTLSLMGIRQMERDRPDSAARGGRRNDFTLRRDRSDRRRPDSRYSLSLDRHKTLANGVLFHMDVYAIKYRLNLFSNFTLLSQRSDEWRSVRAGGRPHRRRADAPLGAHENWGERQVTHKLGIDARRDDINVALYNTSARSGWAATPSTARSDKVLQTGVGLYYENACNGPTSSQHRGRARGFLRRERGQRSRRELGTTRAHVASPKLSFIFGPFDKTEYFLNYGQGFHSNDARGTTIAAATKVPALVKTRGEEIGINAARWSGICNHRCRCGSSPWTRSWSLKATAATTEASRPSLRRGIELGPSLLAADLSVSRRRRIHRDADPLVAAHFTLPGRSTGRRRR